MKLIHRCRKCGHDEKWHAASDGCGLGACPCRQPDPDPEPVVVPTFDNATGQVVERLLEPGASGGLGYPSCRCDACVAAWNAEAVAT